MNTLFTRLSFVFAGFLLVLGLLVWWISHRSNEEYFLEFTQHLNAPIAMYIAQNAGLMDTGVPDSDMLAELAPHVMMLNPSVEVYLLDASGYIIAAAPMDKQLARQKISLQPIRQFLQPDRIFPIKGDNPKLNEGHNIFSAFPLLSDPDNPADSSVKGYVYAVLAGERHQSLLASLSGSYSFKNLTITLLGVLLLALLGGVAVFFMLTRRLRRLTSDARLWQQSLNLRCKVPAVDSSRLAAADEIDQLSNTYKAMAVQLVDQNSLLESNDAARREFTANISHDLRTPLTTMQSYLETLLLKENVLSESERRNYLNIAYRQSKHLRHLVSQLFTLTKLESGEIAPQFERFCFLELAHDTCAEFQLKAERSGVDLRVMPSAGIGGEFDVYADIGMMHRVLDNLVSNALRHTSRGGEIRVSVSRKPDSDDFVIHFSDSGCGMNPLQQAQVVQRYFTGASIEKRAEGQSGLGLAIVQHILNLHDRVLSIQSEIGIGTRISFSLQAAAVAPLQVETDQITSQMAG